MLCVPGYFDRLVGAELVLMASVVSGCWPLELKQLQVRRPGAFSNVLLILLAPIAGLKWAWQCVQELVAGDLAGRPKHLDRGPTYPMEVEVDGKNGAHWYLQS